MPKQFATVTVIGGDKAGVIARFTQTLFQLHANIEALEEQVTRRQFSMTLQASWTPKNFQKAAITTALHATARALGMECRIHFALPGPQRFAILVTRETHVFKALIRESRRKKNGLGATPVVVIGNRPDFAPLARKAGLPFHCVPFTDRARAEEKTLAVLDQYNVNFLVLARFMKILSPNFVWRWKNKIINIHPSLLPAFPGANAYRQAWEKGVKVIGVTAHFVTPHLDEGPIIAQEIIRVKPGESLGGIVARGQAIEARCLVHAVKIFVRKQLDVHWGRVYGA